MKQQNALGGQDHKRGRPAPTGPRRFAFAALLAAGTMLLAELAHAATGDAFAGKVETKGAVLALLGAFGWGVGTSLTGCVYPMIPITIGIFGARRASRGRAILLSLTFVLGIVAMFTSLGLVAALTRSFFGAVLTNPITLTFVAVLFVALALSMFGVFELTLPSALQNSLARFGGAGFGGVFALGLVSGIIASPCTGPPFLSILAFVATRANLALGFGALVAFSLGLGLLFFLVGAFAVALPKPGPWMDSIKSALGLVMLGLAFYYLKDAYPILVAPLKGGLSAPIVVGAVLLVVAGLLVGAVHLSFHAPRWVRAKKAAGIALVAVGVFALIGGASARAPALRWVEDEGRGVALARTERRPIVIDFWATWCAACGQLERETFSHPSVRSEVARFVPIRVDLTHGNEALEQKYRIRGLPLVLVLDSRGAVARRIEGFIPPPEMLRILRSVD